MDDFIVSTDISGVPAIFGSHHSQEFVLVWKSALSLDINAARFDASGQKLGDGFKVNTSDGSRVGSPVVAPIRNFLSPGFVIAWISAGKVFLQRFTSEGVKSGVAIQGNSTETDPEEQVPALAGMPGGEFVVSWGQGVGGIRAQIFRSDGTRVGSEIIVNTSEGPHFSPAITSLGGGGFVIAWSARPSAPGGSRRFQIFDSDGTKLGGEQTPEHGIGLGPSTLTFIDPAAPTASTMPEPNDFVNLILSDAGSHGMSTVQIVVAQLFGPDGTLKHSINVTHKDDKTISTHPAITVLPARRLIAAWNERKIPTLGEFEIDIKAKVLEVQASGAADFLVESGVSVRVNTEPKLPVSENDPDLKKDRDLPCMAAIGELGEFVAFAWIEQNLEFSFNPTLKARVLSNQLT